MIDLLHKIQGGAALLLGKTVVNVLHLLLGQRGREHLLDVGNADALLQTADHQKIGQMDPGIPLFDRCGHDFFAHIVVDGGGGHHGIHAHFLGQKAQIAVEQGHHLIHVKIQRGQLVPGGERVLVQIGFPFAHPLDDAFAIVMHSISLAQSPPADRLLRHNSSTGR